MNPNAGEGNNNQSPVTNTATVVDRPLNTTAELNTGTPLNPLDKLESVVVAAQEAAAQTPEGQFNNQFGEPTTPPVAEPVPGLDTALANLESTPAAFDAAPPAETPSSSVASLDPNINTVADLLAKGPQVVEAVAPAEKSPADKLKEQVAASIDEFLAKVTTKEEITA